MATTKASTKPAASFLSDEQTADVAKDAKSEDRYANPSKFPEGKEQRFRVFGVGLTGYEGWIVNEGGKKKPIRWAVKPEDDQLPANMARDEKTGAIQEIKRFLCALVWDYGKDAFAILNVTQKSIMKDMMGLMADELDFGDIRNYDIKITKTGSGVDSRYSTTGAQIREAPAAAIAAYEDPEFFCDLSLMMENLDPFDPKSREKKLEDPSDLD